MGEVGVEVATQVATPVEEEATPVEAEATPVEEAPPQLLWCQVALEDPTVAPTVVAPMEADPTVGPMEEDHMGATPQVDTPRAPARFVAN